MARPPAIETEAALWLALDVSSLRLTDDQLVRLFRDNDEYRFEMSAAGELIIMSPSTPKTDDKNVTIITRLRNWAERDGTGHSFGNNAMFTLPNGAKRCPDASWIPNSRWNRFTEDEKDSLTKICPDFVIELRSKSDRLAKIKEKMEEYIPMALASAGCWIRMRTVQRFIVPAKHRKSSRIPRFLRAIPSCQDFGSISEKSSERAANSGRRHIGLAAGPGKGCTQI